MESCSVGPWGLAPGPPQDVFAVGVGSQGDSTVGPALLRGTRPLETSASQSTGSGFPPLPTWVRHSPFSQFPGPRGSYRLIWRVLDSVTPNAKPSSVLASAWGCLSHVVFKGLLGPHKPQVETNWPRVGALRPLVATIGRRHGLCSWPRSAGRFHSSGLSGEEQPNSPWERIAKGLGLGATLPGTQGPRLLRGTEVVNPAPALLDSAACFGGPGCTPCSRELVHPLRRNFIEFSSRQNCCRTQ